MQKRNWLLRDSFRCAFHGIIHTVLTERNMRIHISSAALVLYFAYHMQFSSVEWCILTLAIGGVCAGEIFNTAIEHAIDAKTSEYHEFAKLAKDAAAGGELVLAIMAAVLGLILFLQNGRIHTLLQICTSSWLRSSALAVYIIIALWFIFSEKNKRDGGKKIDSEV